MIISMSQPAESPAKDPVTKPEPVKPKVRVTRQRGKLIVGITAAAKEGKAPATRPGTKTDKILKLLQRPGGASLAELTRATRWQAHSVRGFLSGAVKGKMRLRITSFQRDDHERAYRIPSK